jgi:tetratricopeptide (TPR) repeat protein
MKKPQNVKICLNAMVGSEANTIERMLKSVVGYVDYYVIQCNGNDNTKQIIDTFFAANNVPGFTYEIAWDYPGWNRDHTLQTCLSADHGCDWILRMDADEQLRVDEDYNWLQFTDTSIDSFNIVADPGDSLYFRTWLWNAKRPWFFAHDKRHETIHLPQIGENFTRVSLDGGFRHIITNDGETWFAPMKFLNDALELERDKVVSTKVLEDPYHLWYIAKSYSDAYGDPNQFPFGMHHAREYARRCIFYFNMYLNQVHNYLETNKPNGLDDMAYYGLNLVGNAYEFLGESDNAIDSWNKASEFNPRRNENLYRLAEHHESNGDYDEMLRATSKMVSTERSNPFPDYSFMIHNSAYYNTSPLPLWMHLKALKKASVFYTRPNETAELIQKTEQEIKRLHPNAPEFITNEFLHVNEPVAVVKPVIFENTESTKNVFGFTR